MDPRVADARIHLPAPGVLAKYSENKTEPVLRQGCAKPVRQWKLRAVDDHGLTRRGLLTPTTTARRAALTISRAITALAVGTLLVGTMAPAVAAANGLELTTPFPAVVVAPGSKVSFDITVTSSRQADIALAVKGAPTGWTATLHGGGFVVDGATAGPGKPATVRLDVSVPGDAADGGLAR